MIDLTGHTPFAAGYNRHCYQHPEQPDICLKVLIPANIERRFQRQPLAKKLLGRKRLDDNRQETRAHQQPAISRLLNAGQASTVWQHLPRFDGTVDTSLGPANASELVRTADGQPAPTLETLLAQGQWQPTLIEACDRFQQWLLRYGILTRNLLPHNLVVTDRSGRQELLLVDGLGAPTLQHHLSTIPALRQRYLQRKLKRFHRRIQWELAGRPTRWQDAENS